MDDALERERQEMERGNARLAAKELAVVWPMIPGTLVTLTISRHRGIVFKIEEIPTGPLGRRKVHLEREGNDDKVTVYEKDIVLHTLNASGNHHALQQQPTTPCLVIQLQLLTPGTNLHERINGSHHKCIIMSPPPFGDNHQGF